MGKPASLFVFLMKGVGCCFAETTQGRLFNGFILQFCKQRDNVGFVCAAAVIYKHKSRIKDLVPLEDKHLLLVSAST